jgi:hypothetical protein
MEKKKRGGLLKILLIIFVVLILILAGVFFYVYNFYSFKTIRVCIVNNETDTHKACQTQQDCMDFLYANQPNLKTQMESVPSFAQEKIQEIFAKAVICEGTCKIKKVRGMGSVNGQIGVDSCVSGEEEIKMEIHGKEAIQFLSYAKANIKAG